MMKKNNQTHKSQEVRLRFAPSPTGHLHVGGARTALYNYLYAQKNQGSFVIRVEDTDEERSSNDFLKSMLKDLEWLGLKWDEGPDLQLQNHGDYGPYFQSQRKEIYNKYANELLESGRAYYCFLSDEELEKQRDQAKEKGVPFRPESPYRDWPLKKAEERLEKETASIRFKNDYDQEFKFNDLVRGEVSFPSDMIGDFVIVRSNGMPVYNFVCAIDDALMKITHVLRAEEHLSNTLKQMMIYDSFQWKLPYFGHLSIMLGEDRQKLSKRHGATSLSEFQKQGYLPEALSNFVALVGWSSPDGKEILSMQEMKDNFSSDRFNPAAAVFDVEKLKWMNAQYLRALPELDLWKRLESFFEKDNLKFNGDDEWKKKVIEAFKSSMETLADGPVVLKPLSETPLVLDEQAKDVLTWEQTKDVIRILESEVKQSSEAYLSNEVLDQVMQKSKDELGVKGKTLFMPLRVALIGKAHGTEIKDLFPLLRKDVLLDRISTVLG